HDLVTAHDERPAFAVGAWDLCVDEHVLDLLRAPREPVPRAPPPYPKAWDPGADPEAAPAHLSDELDGCLLEPEPLVLAHGRDPAAQVDAARADRRVEQLRERGIERAARLERAEDVRPGGRMDPLEPREDLVADQSTHRARVRRVDAEGKPVLVAVR